MSGIKEAVQKNSAADEFRRPSSDSALGPTVWKEDSRTDRTSTSSSSDGSFEGRSPFDLGGPGSASDTDVIMVGRTADDRIGSHVRSLSPKSSAFMHPEESPSLTDPNELNDEVPDHQQNGLPPSSSQNDDIDNGSGQPHPIRDEQVAAGPQPRDQAEHRSSRFVVVDAPPGGSNSDKGVRSSSSSSGKSRQSIPRRKMKKKGRFTIIDLDTSPLETSHDQWSPRASGTPEVVESPSNWSASHQHRLGEQPPCRISERRHREKRAQTMGSVPHFHSQRNSSPQSCDGRAYSNGLSAEDPPRRQPGQTCAGVIRTQAHLQGSSRSSSGDFSENDVGMDRSREASNPGTARSVEVSGIERQLQTFAESQLQMQALLREALVKLRHTSVGEAERTSREKPESGTSGREEVSRPTSGLSTDRIYSNLVNLQQLVDALSDRNLHLERKTVMLEQLLMKERIRSEQLREQLEEYEQCLDMKELELESLTREAMLLDKAMSKARSKLEDDDETSTAATHDGDAEGKETDKGQEDLSSVTEDLARERERRTSISGMQRPSSGYLQRQAGGYIRSLRRPHPMRRNTLSESEPGLIQSMQTNGADPGLMTLDELIRSQFTDNGNLPLSSNSTKGGHQPAEFMGSSGTNAYMMRSPDIPASAMTNGTNGGLNIQPMASYAGSYNPTALQPSRMNGCLVSSPSSQQQGPILGGLMREGMYTDHGMVSPIFSNSYNQQGMYMSPQPQYRPNRMVAYGPTPQYITNQRQQYQHMAVQAGVLRQPSLSSDQQLQAPEPLDGSTPQANSEAPPTKAETVDTRNSSESDSLSVPTRKSEHTKQ